MKKMIVLLSLVLAISIASAQQDAMFTHYMFNTQAINPAYAGSRQALTVTGLHRSQWVGFSDAPVTQTLTMHTPIFKEDLGLGLSFINDKAGPVRKTSFALDLSYRVQVTTKSYLAFGLKGGLGWTNMQLADLKVNDLGEEMLLANQSGKLLPNFGFGMYYYSDRFYAGLSAPRLLENNLNTKDLKSVGKSLEKRHYYMILGAVFNLGESIKLKPTGLLKVAPGSPVQADLTATFLIKDRFWIGAMYRTGDAAGILAGMYITPQLALGYSFDSSFSNTTFKYNGGSHEVMLRYDFIFTNKFKVQSPRYF